MLWLVHTAEGKTSGTVPGFAGFSGRLSTFWARSWVDLRVSLKGSWLSHSRLFSVVVRAFASRVRIPPPLCWAYTFRRAAKGCTKGCTSEARNGG